MSYGSDYRDRQRRSRRREQRLVFNVVRSIVVTAALVAIAFAFDVPKKIRQKLVPADPVAVAERDNPVPQLSAQRSVEESLDALDRSEQKSEPQLSDAAAEIEQVKVTDAPPHSPSPTALERNVQPAVADQYAGRRVRLRLDKKQVKISLTELDSKDQLEERVRIIALRNIDEKVELSPKDGIVAGDSELQILFPEYPRVRILINTERIGNRVFLMVEPQMASRMGVPMPYTLSKIKSEAFKVRREARDLINLQTQENAELPRLTNLLNSARLPLADYKQGKLRLGILKDNVKQREGQIKEVSQSVEQANAIEKLAGVMHRRAELCFEVLDNH